MTQQMLNGRVLEGMMKTAVQHQIHVERSRVVVVLMENVAGDISFAQIAQLVVDQILIQHRDKNVVTLKVMIMSYSSIELNM